MGKTEQVTDKQNNKDNTQKEQIMSDLEQLAAMEADRLKSLLFDCGVSDLHVSLLSATISNTAWMKVKLDEARDAIKTSNVVIPYDNGGGQKGLRENPLFKGYESLFKSYMSGMKQILDTLPKQAAEIRDAEIEKPQTMLELVRKKHRKEA